MNEEKIKGSHQIRIDSYNRQLTNEEAFFIVVRFCEKNRELVQQILKLQKKETYKFNRINCPFTTSCNAFPCETLHCNADTLSNGYAYRMS